MGVVTWKNVGQTNPAGILNAAAASAKAIGEGFAGVGEASQEFAENKTQRETDDFVADLMALGTQEERDAMIGEAETGWLNIDTINKTNYELGAPDREKKAFEEQLAASQLSEMQVMEQKLKDEKNLLEYKFTHGYYTGSAGGSGSNKKKTYDSKDNDPWKVDGSVFPSKDDAWHGFGTGVGDEEKANYRSATQQFLSDAYDTGLVGSVDSGKGDGTTRREITAWHINELAQKGLLTFEDNISLPDWTGMDDAFIFKHAGTWYQFDEKMDQKTSDAFYEVIMKEVLGKETETVVNKKLYWKDFLSNNPTLNTAESFDKALGIFEQKYNEHIKNKKSYNSEKSSVIFKMLDPNEDTSSSATQSKQTDEPKQVYDSSTKSFDIVPVEEITNRRYTFGEYYAGDAANQVANEINGMDSVKMQSVYDKLVKRQDAMKLKNKNLDEFELELMKQLGQALDILKLSTTGSANSASSASSNSSDQRM